MLLNQSSWPNHNHNFSKNSLNIYACSVTRNICFGIFETHDAIFSTQVVTLSKADNISFSSRRQSPRKFRLFIADYLT